jgi:hypothetical protein
MRQRNSYGLAGTPTARTINRPAPGPRRPVTKRGQLAFESSRRRFLPRADS